MRMAPSGSQFGNQYKWRHQVNKFSTNADIFAVLAVPAVWASSPSSPALLTVLAVQAVLLLALLLCTYRIYRALWACFRTESPLLQLVSFFFARLILKENLCPQVDKVHIPCCLNSFIISWVQTAPQSSSSVFLMKRDRSRKSLLSHEQTVTDGDGHFPEGNSPSGSPELIQLPQLVAQLQFLWITN